MNPRRSIRYGIFAAALFASSTISAGAQEPADHTAHHPDQQQTTAQPQSSSETQMMGGCPNMMDQGG
jgi:hypothetical protein